MCEHGLPATQEGEAIVDCWETEHRWDARYTHDLVDIYRRKFPNARSITFCVNGEHRGGWVGAIGESS